MKKKMKKVTKSVSKSVTKVAKKVSKGVTKVAKTVAKGASSALSAVTSAFKKIGSFFKKMFENITKVLGMMKSISTFLFKNLTSFIQLMWKLLIGLYNFITKWVPKFIKKFFTFWKYLFIKAKKTGLVTIGLYGLLNMGLTKYWDLLLGDIEAEGQSAATFVPEQMVTYPALFFTAHIFWTQTPALANLQQSITRFIASNLSALEFFLVTILGLPTTTLFKAKMSTSRRLTLLITYVKKNLPQFVLRSFVFLIIFKKLIIDSGVKNILNEGIPSFRDLLLFPIVIIRFLLQLIFNLI